MRIIALTGGIATGKSTVARMLCGHGAVVVDADRIAREVVEPGTPGLEMVVAAFGRQLLTAGGGLDRGALAEIVFSDAESRRRLEAITHPLILARMAVEVAALVGSDAPLVVVEHPLLFERGHQTQFPDGVLLVYADPATQIRRLRERGGTRRRGRPAAAGGAAPHRRQAWPRHLGHRQPGEPDGHPAGRRCLVAGPCRTAGPREAVRAPLSDPTRPRDGGVG